MKLSGESENLHSFELATSPNNPYNALLPKRGENIIFNGISYKVIYPFSEGGISGIFISSDGNPDSAIFLNGEDLQGCEPEKNVTGSNFVEIYSQQKIKLYKLAIAQVLQV